MDNLLRYLWGGGKNVKVTGQLLAILLSPFTMNYRDGLSVISSGLILSTLTQNDYGRTWCREIFLKL